MLKKVSGYTIVELMIVLAVTGMIAVGAISSLQGQQARTEFTQALRDFDAQLIDVANDVANGYFPTDVNAPECTVNAATDKPSFSLSVNAGQGGSAECIFVGKALQFEPDGQEGKINVIALAGRRIGDTDIEVSSITEANPVAVVSTAPPYDLTQVLSIQLGMKVKSITPSTGVIAFVSNFSNVNVGTGDVSGSPSTDVKYIDNTALNDAKLDVVNDLDFTPNYLDLPTTGIQICLEKDGRTALVTLGANDRKLKTETEVDAGC